MLNNIKRGDIYYADLNPVVGSEQGGIRPVLIIQNNIGNQFSPTVIVAAITSRKDKTNIPTHISLSLKKSGLPKESVILMEQIRTIDKHRLIKYAGHIGNDMLKRVDQAVKISFGIAA